MILAWVLSVIFGSYIGYRFERLKTQVENIKVVIKDKVDKKKDPEITSNFIDPSDPLTVAKFEHDILMEKINPK